MLQEDILDVTLPGVLDMNMIHFVFLKAIEALMLNLSTWVMSTIQLLERPAYDTRIVLTTKEDGRLGFTVCLESVTIKLSSLESDPVGNPGGPWMVCTVTIHIKKLPAVHSSTVGAHLVWLPL